MKSDISDNIIKLCLQLDFSYLYMISQSLNLPDLQMIIPEIYRSLRNSYQNVFLFQEELTLRSKLQLSYFQ